MDVKLMMMMMMITGGFSFVERRASQIYLTNLSLVIYTCTTIQQKILHLLLLVHFDHNPTIRKIETGKFCAKQEN